MGKKYTADDFVGAVTGTASGNVAKTGDTMTGTLTNTATSTTTRINNTNAQTGAGMLSFQADSGSITDKFVFSRSGSGGQQGSIEFNENSGTSLLENTLKFKLNTPAAYTGNDILDLSMGGGSSPTNRTFIKTHKPIIAADGIYLGTSSVTSANKLDDYEEGAFTPSYTGSSGMAVTHDIQIGRYVKIGRLVHFSISLGTDSVGYCSGNLEITGLPFTATDLDGAATPGLNYAFDVSLANYRFTVTQNTTIIRIYNSNSTSQFATCSTASGTNSNRLKLVGTYITTT